MPSSVNGGIGICDGGSDGRRHMLQDRKSEHGKFGSIRTAILTYGVQRVVDVVRPMAKISYHQQVWPLSRHQTTGPFSGQVWLYR